MYTSWIITTFPHLKDQSDVVINGLIRQAKKDTKYYRMTISPALILFMVVFMLGVIFPIIDLEPFSNWFSWLVFCFPMFIIGFISDKIEIYLIKHRLKIIAYNT